MKKTTKAIHAGQHPDPTTGAIIPPIYMTSTYVQEYPNTTKGYDYTRAGNPNFTNIEAQIAALEDGKYATIFSAGLGAITGIISTLESGDRVVATEDLYGGTFRLFNSVFKNYGIQFETLNTQDLEEVERVLATKPNYIFIESPTNPLLNITDITAVCDIAKKHGVATVVDNTFASSYFQNPLSLGADVVMHSTTKYMSGHSDTVGGVLVTNDQELKTKFDLDVWPSVLTLALSMFGYAPEESRHFQFAWRDMQKMPCILLKL